MADVITWITVVLGTPIGLLSFLMGGLGKLLPFHPYNKAMSYGFANVWGPFIGCPGTVLRILIGLGELAAGLGILVAVWCDALDVFDKSLSDLSKALVIAAGVSLFILHAIAALMHKYVDGSPGMPAGLAVLDLIFVLLRMVWVGPDHTTNQIIATVISMVVMVGVIITMIINKTKGMHEAAVEEENRKLHEMM